ncbi:MAG: hypothetical protein JRI23_19495 [Deltaproteobacteria bacterium]|jgi:alpha-tubulin suppressor-like RCC1 family protein|nr:hypothetical protein [Deltaproteobacteria bacterium]MBW2534050.1 hypothetical protein [Deltaproteobacteria bacterium]
MLRLFLVLLSCAFVGGGCHEETGDADGGGGQAGSPGTSGTTSGSGTTASGGSGATDAPIQQVRAGRHHTCVRLRDGTLYCWGQGAFRALGGDYNAQHTPREVEAFSDAVFIDSGARYGCAIRSAGDTWCWGDNGTRQIGVNATVPCGDCTPLPECATSECVPTPQPMPGLDSGVAELALGEGHGCARRTDGTVVCWGDNSHGQLGQADLSMVATSPQQVPGLSGVSQLWAGTSHNCALLDSPGQVVCWGRNDRAQVGNGETSDAVSTPTAVAGVDDAAEVVAGGSHSCARRSGGTVACWGYNYLGALGNGSTSPTRATSPQEVVELGDAMALAAGDHFTCALRSNQRVSCWGHNANGQLGDGTTDGVNCSGRVCKTAPVEVLVVRGATNINAGHLHACAASGEGRLWCWGYNLGGQLGTGSVSSDPTPTPVEVTGLPIP